MYIILLYIPKLLWSVLWVSMFSWILVFLHTLSTKWEYIMTARIPKYIYDQTHMIELCFPFYFLICVRFYEY